MLHISNQSIYFTSGRMNFQKAELNNSQEWGWEWSTGTVETGVGEENQESR